MRLGLLGPLCGLCVGVVLIYISSLYRFDRNEIETWLLSPPEDLKHFTFGYHENFADALWIRTIQDFDICESAGRAVRPVHTNDFPNSREEQESASAETAGTSAPVTPLEVNGARIPRCQNGWVFRMLSAITELAPRFRAPYLYGAINLSVIVDDIKGASILFDRGLERFSDDWQFAYRAAYHFLVEENQKEKAANLLVQAGNHGAPVWVYSLATRLMTDEGMLELARSVIEEQMREHTDPKLRSLLQERLEDIERKVRKTN